MEPKGKSLNKLRREGVGLDPKHGARLRRNEEGGTNHSGSPVLGKALPPLRGGPAREIAESTTKDEGVGNMPRAVRANEGGRGAFA